MATTLKWALGNPVSGLQARQDVSLYPIYLRSRAYIKSGGIWGGVSIRYPCFFLRRYLAVLLNVFSILVIQIIIYVSSVFNKNYYLNLI